MQTLWQDLRYGARMLVKQPGFTLIAVVTLALGIGANTAIFSVINALLLQPLPFPDAASLVLVWDTQVSEQNRNIVSAPNFQDWQRQSDVFAQMALFDSAGKGYDLSGAGDEAQQVSGVRVSASFFDVLGVKPQLGRGFLPEEETAGRHQVVVLSDGLWRARYNADPALVGKSIRVDGADFTVVGVMPPSFAFQFFSASRQLWVPIAYTKGDLARDSNSFFCLARLKSGVTLAQAQAQMNNLGLQLAQQYPKENAGKSVAVDAASLFGREDQQGTWLTLLAVAGFVLLIACVNVANLLMARGAARQRELEIRAALGATRGRTIRQLLTESLLLAALGGLCGTLLAVWGNSFLLEALPDGLSSIPFRSLNELQLDGRVLAFTWALTALTGILFGLAPAWLFSRRQVSEVLQEGSRGASSGGGRLRQGLVVLEVALTLIVLTGAGLMLQSMRRLLNVAPGLDPNNLLTMTMSLPQENLYYGPPLHPNFARELQTQVGSLPGVTAVSAVSHLPLGNGTAGRSFVIQGRPTPSEDDTPGGAYSVICPDYFRTMGIKLLRGREFTLQDSETAPGVAILNESIAKQFWPNEDALGQRIKLNETTTDNQWLTVVGIAQDVKKGGLDSEVPQEFYRPYSQAAWPAMTVVVRTNGAPMAMLPAIKQALARVEPERGVSRVRTMTEVMASSLSGRRFPMLLLLAFSLVALALAAVGIAGVVSFSVTQRTREIGIRMALGANAADVMRMMMRRSFTAAALGIVVGLIGAFALTRFLTGMLFEVKPLDPFVLTCVVLLLTGVSLLACWIPARRATKVDPMIALRCE